MNQQQQRRVFLKVIAVSPLLGCGPDPSAPHGLGGAAGSEAGGSSGTANNPSSGGAGGASLGGAGSPSFSGGGNASSGGAGSPSFGGSFSSGGSPVSGGGQSGSPAVGGAGAAATAGSTGAAGDPNNPETPIGNVSAYPLGSFSVAGSIFFLGHDAGGLYAMTMACTHAGCACNIKGTELDCPCHGSRFDRQGSVLQGPATKPLPHFPVFVDATGNITVDRFTVVSASTRTPV